MEVNVGYTKYRKKLNGEDVGDVLEQTVLSHCDDILKKYSMGNRNELEVNIGTAQGEHFFVLLDYEGLAVDSDEVFAAAYITDMKLENEKKRDEQYNMCVFFTKDDYIPVFGTVYVEHLNIFERIRKIRKTGFVREIEALCRNLKYPVLEIGDMVNLLKSENGMRDRFNKNYMLEELEDAVNQIGIFDTKKMSCQIGLVAGRQLREHGYTW